ncbi:ribosome maturation factor RimM [Buchnera aphidicola (Macrosiphoniella sanborni)]|uniref:Ribosome maturation factor RimM n=1 Tax=Buchnera aphidicola (Macrosiphoniella sanborni) TaxID=1241865 RepID=A0A4D6Y3E4_9GAMM|nr:ribosome maturation factor RimM [Buchnera aphidicola (Macrosiphoniella sanborni)]
MNIPIQPLLIGKVGKSYGILGWITIFSFTEEKEKIFSYLPWFFYKEKKWTKIIVDDWKKYKNNFIIHIKEISNRSIIKKFTNSDIIISQYTLPKLKKNNYYWTDIINCQVFNIDKNYLGKVIELTRTKNNDILIIQNPFKISKKNILIPFVENTIIKNIKINNKLIIVQWNKMTYSK